MINTSQRTSAPEIMDDFQMEGDTLRQTLDEIAGINQLLGGNRITVQGVRQLLQSIPVDKTVSIVDLGCGNGDMLRTLALKCRKEGRSVKFIGVDANRFTIAHAITLSADYPEIIYHCTDIFSAEFAASKYDIVLCTLTLHHFAEAALKSLLQLLLRNARIGIVINDLHRSRIAYYLFCLFSFVWGLGPMAKEDGRISILRGFKRKELIALAKTLNIVQYTLRWKWAYRYQWIISNL
ncbi:methyltransferase domain-containing protein [Chitinophaga sancti]|uniref:Methyltransferase domain-containing protein n=1 Tax=Chitinophaga sancti TaxID=1004 RepID=A0A1K1R2A2_9BACT|nr:methyltransferase domain-containing protein [Chitinophaga sancti]WQD64333.1 methyltransferase domain-containing protein [Chitinophaga sancti]WQG90043.1 methyltransferase domain-containing protein [Chitinophaga sancti]SFW66338.1 Methyltransferase domain-containing protein [Chitinophaga sancti]